MKTYIKIDELISEVSAGIDASDRIKSLNDDIAMLQNRIAELNIGIQADLDEINLINSVK